jgi:DNA helicase-2/ATP-dependent DNA helicase PcrA
MPQPPNEAAGLGTLFHNWVAGLLDPLTEEPLAAGIPDRGDTQAQIAQLGEGTVEARRFARWQKAFRTSLWAQRQVVAVERPYDMALAGHRIPARLDAVFAGAIDDTPGQEQEGRYTVVDWKTGRPPRTMAERDERLLQLDLYRIAFSRARGVPIENVDACLFYVGAPAGKRQIGLPRRRGEREILAQILANPTAATVLGEDFDEDVTGSPSSD